MPWAAILYCWNGSIEQINIIIITSQCNANCHSMPTVQGHIEWQGRPALTVFTSELKLLHLPWHGVHFPNSRKRCLAANVSCFSDKTSAVPIISAGHVLNTTGHSCCVQYFCIVWWWQLEFYLYETEVNIIHPLLASIMPVFLEGYTVFRIAGKRLMWS